MIAMSKLSIMIVLNTVHRINKPYTINTPTEPKAVTSKSPRMIL